VTVGDRRGLVLVAAGTAGAALCLLTLVLMLGGGAPVALPGLPSVPPAVGWLLGWAPWAHLVLGTLTVSAGLLAGGRLGEPTGTARGVAVGWFCALLATFTLTGVSQHALGVPWRQFPASPQATGVFLALLAVGFTAYVARDAPFAVAPLALVGLLPPLLTGHVRTAPVPWLAAVSMVLHVVAAALWVGGLLAVGYLALGGRGSWLDAARRFSRLALAAAATVAVSGVPLALSRVGSVDDLVGSSYGRLVVGKAVALALLVAVGYRQRDMVMTAGRTGAGAPRPVFLRLAGTEVVVMALTFALAAGLSQTPPP